MSVVEASDAPETYDESVRFLSEHQPLVEGEVLTSGTAEVPHPIEETEEEPEGYE